MEQGKERSKVMSFDKADFARLVNNDLSNSSGGRNFLKKYTQSEVRETIENYKGGIEDLKKLWFEVLKISEDNLPRPLALNDRFEYLGGHSVKAAQLISRLQRKYPFIEIQCN